MAVTTEPPWINNTSGIAPRNGTTSHTIPFGFTSTSGNELVFVIFGAVTHTVAGWTERLQPVNSGELSVFTKTSAGESSITVTHNGSNFPTPWVVYEFPTGTTWVNGVGSSPTSDTFPQLTGLPAAEVVVFGGRGRTAVAVVDTAASSTVSPPWVEDADLFVPDDATTDGAYLYVTHQINVTATSITPTATSTYVGTWSTADRQHVVFALNVAATGGVSGTLAGAFPALAGSLSGVATVDGVLSGALPALTGGSTGAVTASGSFSGTLPAFAGTLSGSVADNTVRGAISAVLPAFTGGLTAALTATGSVSATLPSLTAALSAAATVTGALSGTLPAFTGSFIEGRAIITRPNTGTVDRPFTGSVLRPFTGLITRPFTGDITRP